MALWTAWRSFYFLENRSGVIWNPLTSCSWRVVFSSHPTGWRNAKKKRSYDPNFPAAHDRCLSLQVPVNVGRLAFSFNHSLAKVGASAWQRRAVCERLSRPSRLLARVLGSVCSSSEESAKCTWGLYSGSVINRFCPPTQNKAAWHCRNATGRQAPASTEQESKMADGYNTRAFGPKWNSLLPGSPPGLPRLNGPYAYLVIFPHRQRCHVVANMVLTRPCSYPWCVTVKAPQGIQENGKQESFIHARSPIISRYNSITL